MKNIEKIMTRDAIAQLLADNGINRETIVDMVRESIDEKVEKAISRVLHDKNVDFDRLVSKSIKQEMQDDICAAVRRALGRVSISISHDPVNLAVEE